MSYTSSGAGPSRWEEAGVVRLSDLPSGEWHRGTAGSVQGEVRFMLHDIDRNPFLETHSLPLMWNPTDEKRAEWREWFRRHGIDMDLVYTPTKITRDLRKYRVTYTGVLGEPHQVQLEGPPLPFPPMRHCT